MSAGARDRILRRLRQAPGGLPLPAPDIAAYYAAHRREDDPAARLVRFRAALLASHAEVHDADDDTWPDLVRDIAQAKGLRTLLVGAGTEFSSRLAWKTQQPPEILTYDRDMAEWREELFGVDASLTGARCGIADTGGLILWPGPREPRLMSLVPPVHFVLLDPATIHADLYAAMSSEGWQEGLPTNALMISGPSKTADIQQVLAYGAHGPRELIVLLRHGRGART